MGRLETMIQTYSWVELISCNMKGAIMVTKSSIDFVVDGLENK
jgi:hypothetical protein